MICNITSGIPRGCRENAGGVYQFYIASYPDALTVETAGSTNGEITAIYDTDREDQAEFLDFYPFIPNKNSSDFTENYQVSLENGTVGYEQVATMIFSKMEAIKANKIKMLASGTVLVIVKDKNGNYFLMGENDGADLSGGNAGTGKALTDLNGYNITLTAMEGSPANQIDSDQIIVDNGVLTVELSQQQ